MSSVSSVLEQIAGQIADQPVTRKLLSEASVWRDRTLRLQEGALGALNVPTAADLARVERRVRSVAEGLARLEEHVDRVEATVRRDAGDGASVQALRAELATLRAQLEAPDETLASTE